MRTFAVGDVFEFVEQALVLGATVDLVVAVLDVVLDAMGRPLADAAGGLLLLQGLAEGVGAADDRTLEETLDQEDERLHVAIHLVAQQLEIVRLELTPHHLQLLNRIKHEQLAWLACLVG
jgi:hypothetical protein